MSYITQATGMVSKVRRKGQLITLETTTYPGTTRGDCLPILAESDGPGSKTISGSTCDRCGNRTTFG